MELFDKIKWILGILMILSLIITTNLVDRSNFSRMNAAVETIYEDRLVVKDLILKITTDIHQKEIAAIEADASFYAKQNKQINSEIDGHLLSYAQTKLTNKEELFLNDFKRNLIELRKNEMDFIQSNYVQDSTLLNLFQVVKRDLKNLAEIQLAEGSRQFEISRRAMGTVDLFTQIEIYILIFLAIVIQIIIIYSPKKDS
ncbi:Four helix bundle sensory module for signal transduction [Marivirga sericea]|uniref:Four helix bundle sensory module for signal transduction n=1 Tax=Marivirga sericea TaxID=1028 RepID=A0A1X7KE38_9BACT|nr:MCP four helix bundle domain-containing protein [Marivirga sericea]SMG39501.1 Four helix bundle sensory module for signal transduction [Marivirga sericea]